MTSGLHVLGVENIFFSNVNKTHVSWNTLQFKLTLLNFRTHYGPRVKKFKTVYQDFFFFFWKNIPQGVTKTNSEETYLLWRSMLDCLSRDTSGLRLLSLLVRLQTWLRSSCSLCRLFCSSAFSLLSSCSSLNGAQEFVQFTMGSRSSHSILDSSGTFCQLQQTSYTYMFSMSTFHSAFKLVHCTGTTFQTRTQNTALETFYIPSLQCSEQK